MPEQAPVVFENQHTSVLQLGDVLDGTTIILPVTRETAGMDLTTGAKYYQTTNSRVIAANGAITATTEDLVKCRGKDCGRIYTKSATKECLDCGIILGKTCCIKNQQSPRCDRCAKAHFWRTLWDNLKRIG